MIFMFYLFVTQKKNILDYNITSIDDLLYNIIINNNKWE